jgi:Methyltransferase domain
MRVTSRSSLAGAMASNLVARLLARSPAIHDRLRALRRDIWFLRALRRLPWRVAAFQWRAWRLGAQLGDEFGRASATRPSKLATLLKLAGDGRFVAELGTAQAWTAISLALAHPEREVISYDAFERPQPRQYLQLVPEQVRQRVTLLVERGDTGPRTSRPVDLLYVDTNHDRADTIRELEAWWPVLRDAAWVVLDDYGHPDFPGVKEAVGELRLAGEERDGLFVHRVVR